MVDPQAAMRNFTRLTSAGALGRHGFYEALDYTRSRLPEDAEVVIVKAYMAHHQGMTIVAIANVLFDGRMRARFHAESSVQATELLLQERTPRDVSVAHPRAEEVKASARIGDTQLPAVRRLHTAHSATPQTHILSNGRYAVMLSSAGSGYSRWGDIGITRWREDATRDDSGSYLFLRDVESGTVWSAGYQPCGVEPDSYEVTFTEDRAEFIRTDGTLTTTLEVVVSPEDDAEVRRISIANTGASVRDIDVTSYGELTLAPPAADTAHPAFSKLFVQTKYVAKLGVLLATRRRRSPGEPEIWAAHHVVVEGETVGPSEYETDRARFLGRGREVHEPLAVVDGRPLSKTIGTVLDPVFALRQRVRIPPGATARLSFWTVVSSSRASVLDLFDKHQDANAYVRAATLSWTQAQVQLRHLGVTAEEANLFQRIAGHVLYADASMRPSSATIRARQQHAICLVGPGNFRRCSHRAAQNRAHRRPRHRPAIVAGSRILAAQAARSRSRDPERTRGFLCAGSAGRSRNGCPHASLTSATSCRQRERFCVRAAHRHGFSRDTSGTVVCCTGGIRRRARHARGSTRATH